jgi:hypothetical protein
MNHEREQRTIDAINDKLKYNIYRKGGYSQESGQMLGETQLGGSQKQHSFLPMLTLYIPAQSYKPQSTNFKFKKCKTEISNNLP